MKKNEYLMTSLRTKWGCNLDILLDDISMQERYNYIKKLEYYKSMGEIHIKNNTIYVSNQTKLVIDSLLERLFF